MFIFPQPQYVVCEDCGCPVWRWEWDDHECEPDRYVDHQMVKLSPGVMRFEEDLGEWLKTNQGQFEVLYAADTRPGA